ncbi:DUF1178 family protein [Sphingorhabdus sp.]|uniref:DUF1178 family protein n=1 Tax=Sphingorhabdus sp. TaxID=1902408 RepID=UPI00391C91A1
MIAFDLNCSNGHQFEGWFTSSAEFDSQKANGILACPLCDDVTVQKALSVPNVARKSNQRAVTTPSSSSPAVEVRGEAAATEPVPPAMVELVQKLAQAQTEMLEKSQWVGGNFAETARAIHYGEEPDRLIHGETSAHETKELLEEGIPITPLLFSVVPPNAKN